MKRIIFMLSAVAAVAAYGQSTQPSKLSGSLSGFDKQPFVIFETSGENSKPDTLKLTADGKFATSVELTKASTGFLKLAETDKDLDSYCLYMLPGKTLDVELSRGTDGKITARFGGDTGTQTEYDNASRQLFTLSRTFSVDEMLNHGDFNSWRTYVKEQFAGLDKQLDKVQDADFVKTERATLTNGMPGYLFDYALNMQKKGHDMEKDAAYMEYTKGINFNDTTQLRSITGYIDWYLTAHPDTKAPSDDVARLRMVKALSTNPDVRNMVAENILSFQFFAMMFGADVTDVLPGLYREFLNVSTDKARCDYVRSELAKIEHQEVGKPAYPLPLHDASGRKTTLKDIVGKGKYTYVDFWATWCVPCRKETPHFARLAEKYKGKAIRFVSISIDENLAKWKAFIAKEKPSWPQYRVPKEKQGLCADIYGITGIPRFMLFDKQGRIMKASALRPSDPDMEKLIDKSLEAE